jgi:hypothetical protein
LSWLNEDWAVEKTWTAYQGGRVGHIETSLWDRKRGRLILVTVGVSVYYSQGSVASRLTRFSEFFAGRRIYSVSFAQSLASHPSFSSYRSFDFISCINSSTSTYAPSTKYDRPDSESTFTSFIPRSFPFTLSHRRRSHRW